MESYLKKPVRTGHMDSTDSDQVRSTLQAQQFRLRQQEEQLSQLNLDIRGMSERQESLFAAVSEQVINLAAQIQKLSSPPISPALSSTPPQAPVTPSVSNSPVYVPHLARPEKFSGDSSDCRVSLTQHELHFELQELRLS